jgi:hypothetical protein
MPDNQILNLEGGDSLDPQFQIAGGDSGYYMSNGSTGGFSTEYTNVAQTYTDLRRINATFRRFNDPSNVRFVKEYFCITNKENTLDKILLSEFFHPLQSFSEYQKQTVILDPLTTINLDPSSFYSTGGEVSLILVKAEYLPEAESNERIIFWDYGNAPRKIMGSIMVLSGSVKNGSAWHGWDVNPFESYEESFDLPTIEGGGISFNNPTKKKVKLIILTAS